MARSNRKGRSYDAQGKWEKLSKQICKWKNGREIKQDENSAAATFVLEPAEHELLCSREFIASFVKNYKIKYSNALNLCFCFGCHLKQLPPAPLSVVGPYSSARANRNKMINEIII